MMSDNQPALFDLPPEQPKTPRPLNEPPPAKGQFIAVVRQLAGQKSPDDKMIWRTHENGENEYMTRGELETTTKKPRRWKSWQAARRYLEANYKQNNITIEVYRESE